MMGSKKNKPAADIFSSKLDSGSAFNNSMVHKKRDRTREKKLGGDLDSSNNQSSFIMGAHGPVCGVPRRGAM